MTSSRYKLPYFHFRLLFLILACLLPIASPLKCFACTNARDNSECSQPEHVVDCTDVSPPAIEYDTCQTKLTYTDDEGLLISKKCVQGPCTLGVDQSNALGMECDRSRPNWSCMACCKENQCNVNHAPVVFISQFLLIVTSFGLLLHLVF